VNRAGEKRGEKKAQKGGNKEIRREHSKLKYPGLFVGRGERREMVTFMFRADGDPGCRRTKLNTACPHKKP